MMQRSLVPCLPDSLISQLAELGYSGTTGILEWMQSRHRDVHHKDHSGLLSSENIAVPHLVPGAYFCWTKNPGLVVLSSRTCALGGFWLHHPDRFAILRIISLAREGWSLSQMSRILSFSVAGCDVSWRRFLCICLFRIVSASWTLCCYIFCQAKFPVVISSGTFLLVPILSSSSSIISIIQS